MHISCSIENLRFCSTTARLSRYLLRVGLDFCRIIWPQLKLPKQCQIKVIQSSFLFLLNASLFNDYLKKTKLGLKKVEPFIELQNYLWINFSFFISFLFNLRIIIFNVFYWWFWRNKFLTCHAFWWYILCKTLATE